MRHAVLRSLGGSTKVRHTAGMENFSSHRSSPPGKLLRPLLALNAALAAGALLLAAGLGGGCAGTATKPSTGEYIDDGVVTARVKTALLRDKVTPGTQIQVETFRGVVQLSGFVATVAEKEHAAEVAQAVPGVQKVVNNITLK
jgi:hypothetical protein